jgi:ribosomal protein L29
MKKEELKKKSKVDLEKELGDKRVSLRDLRFGIAGSKSKNVKEQKMIKKEIARINTTLNQK